MDPTTSQPSQPYKPVFIGGQRRSGTTLMFSMLIRHPQLGGVPEESFFFQDKRFESFFSDLLEQYAERFSRLGIGPAEMDHAVAGLLNGLFSSYGLSKSAQRWVEKTTRNIKRIDYLFRLFPEAHFIHMIRDPRDTLCSMKQRIAEDRPDWVKYTAYESAMEWIRVIASGLPWRERPDRYLEVRYEELVREPEATLRRVLSFLGAPWCPAVLESSAAAPFKEGGRDHRPIFTSSVGRWRKDLSPEEVACIQAVAGQTMALLGYPPEDV